MGSGNLTGLIEEGTKLTGNLCFEGVFRINGVLEGDVTSLDTLIVGEKADIRGTVNVGVAIIQGNFEGKLEAKHRVELLGSARFRGELLTPSLRIEEGVYFEGTSKMNSSSEQKN